MGDGKLKKKKKIARLDNNQKIKTGLTEKKTAPPPKKKLNTNIQEIECSNFDIPREPKHSAILVFWNGLEMD